jgi:flagellar biosynthesis protein FlhB
MAEGDDQDKRHAPTERRLREAAERGDVGRSEDLPKAAVIVIITLLALSAAVGIGAHLEDFFAAWLGSAGTVPVAAAGAWAGTLVVEIGPLLVLIAAIGAVATFATGGWVLSLSQLQPDFSKMMPSHGLGQLFSKSGMTDTAKALLKFIIIGGVGGDMIYTRAPQFAALEASTNPSAGPVIALCLQVITAICVAITLLAAGDMGLQYWLHRQKLRMSDADMRNEMKDVVGNPHVRNRQRMLARKMARARQMKRIPEASVIVTNPTHFAVAIRYRRGVDQAPLLLAKGVGMLAAEIISRGRALGIPVIEAPPLARAVYRHVEPGDHVPVALYRACAEVLAYVWKMQRWRAQGGMRPTPPKVQHGEIEVPRGRRS